MSQKHFKPSLSQTRGFNCTATVKWTIRVKKEILTEVTETRPSGGRYFTKSFAVNALTSPYAASNSKCAVVKALVVVDFTNQKRS